MTVRITDKELDEWWAQFMSRSDIHPRDSDVVHRLIVEVRELRKENERLKKLQKVKFDEIYMGPEA